MTSPERRLLLLAAACLAGGVALGAACLAAQGPLPGDLLVTRGLQRSLGGAPAWAELLTRSAKSPLLWSTLGLAAGLAHLRGGWLAAAAPPLALVGVQLVDALLRALVFAPKPIEALVAVASPSAASGLPSTFGLVYGGLFGAAILASGQPGALASASAVLAGALVLAGCGARLVLGGHWASQISASLLVAFAVASATHALLRTWRRSRRKAAAA